jgi:hypothetical protein
VFSERDGVDVLLLYTHLSKKLVSGEMINITGLVEQIYLLFWK